MYGSSPFPEGSGHDDRLSDYVGRLDLRPSEYLDLGLRFRLASDEPELRRSDLGVTVGPSWLRVSMSFSTSSREADAGGGRVRFARGGRLRRPRRARRAADGGQASGAT